MNAKEKSPAQAKKEQLVFIEDNIPMTNSRLIAKTFRKQHRHVLRDIQSIGCSEVFTQSNFGLSYYKDKSGKENKEFHVTKDGFSMLAFGYTGQKAMKFKEDYIERFNLMEQKLKEEALKGQKSISSEATYNDGQIFRTKLGHTTIHACYTNGELYWKLNHFIEFCKYTACSGVELIKKIDLENGIKITVGKQLPWFINKQGIINFLDRITVDISSEKLRIIKIDLLGSDKKEFDIKELFDYFYTNSQMNEILLAVNLSPISKSKVNELLAKGKGCSV